MNSPVVPPRKTQERPPPDSSQSTRRRSGPGAKQPKAKPRGESRKNSGDKSRSTAEAVPKGSSSSMTTSDPTKGSKKKTIKRKDSVVNDDVRPIGGKDTATDGKPVPKRRTSLAKDTSHPPPKTDEMLAQIEDRRTSIASARRTVKKNRRVSPRCAVKGEDTTAVSSNISRKDGQVSAKDGSIKRPEAAQRRNQTPVKTATPLTSRPMQDHTVLQEHSPHDSAVRTPVPAQRRRISSTQRCVGPTLASAFIRPSDGGGRRDLAARPVVSAGLLVVGSSGEIRAENSGTGSKPQSCLLPRREEPDRQAVSPRTASPCPVSVPLQAEFIVSKKDGLLIERPEATPAVLNERRLQPVPLRRCLSHPISAETPPASSCQYSLEPNLINRRPEEQADVTVAVEEFAISSIADRPYGTELSPMHSSEVTVSEEITRELSLLAAPEVAASETPRTVRERTNRPTIISRISSPSPETIENVRPTSGPLSPITMKTLIHGRSIEFSSCTSALHLDDFVNDSLQGIRLPLEGTTEKDARVLTTAPNASGTNLAKLGTPEKDSNNSFRRITESKQLRSTAEATATIEETAEKEKLEREAAKVEEESVAVMRLEKCTQPTVDLKTTAPDDDAGEPERLQEVLNGFDKKKSDASRQNEMAMATEQKYTSGEADAKRVEIPEGAAKRASVANILLMAEEASNASVLGESNIDALIEAWQPPWAGNDELKDDGKEDTKKHATKGDEPGQGEDKLHPPAKTVQISPRTSLIENEELPETTQTLKRREVNVWLEDCRIACENLSSMVALVLVCFILFQVARPMYVRDSVPQEAAQYACHDHWCDRLGLRVLPNKSNQDKDPCGDFYQRVCYEWNAGHENVSFVESVIDSAFAYTRDRIYGSPMPPVIRNDLDHFVVFIRVCLEDPHFKASLADWMALIRYELGNDFLVMPHWNWSRMVRAVIKKSLVDGLQTLVGVRVGRSDESERTGLFLSVDGCLLNMLSAKTNETGAVASLLKEIIDELPEFHDRYDAAAQVNHIALTIARERKAVYRNRIFCAQLDSFAKGVDAAIWLDEINLHVPKTMRIAGNCILIVYERLNHRRLFQVLEDYPIGTRALYINLLVVGQVLKYRYAIVAGAVPKLRVCMRASREAYHYLWVRLMMDVTHLHVQVKYLEDLFESIKQGIIADLERRGGSNVTKLAVRALVNKTQLRPISKAVVEKEANYGGPELVVGYRLPQYFLQTLAFQTKRSMRFLFDEESLKDDEAVTSLLPVYNKKDLSISVPFLLLFRPVFFVYRDEQYHNFATIGVLLAAELIKEANARSLLDWKAANKSANCRIQRYLKTLGSGGDQQEIPSATAVFTWEVAVNAALRSLEKYVKRNMSPMEKIKHGEQLKRIFFERFCMLSCAFPPVPHISNMQRCLLPLMNVDEFADVHGCRPGSGMYPSDRCGVM